MSTEFNGVEAYPLCWPTGRPRTVSIDRKRARFKRSMDRARRDVQTQVSRTGGDALVISTNCELRNDGFPRSDRRPPIDPGVAVYFVDRNQRQLCIACDCWNTVDDNLTAVACTIEAMRGIERWGGQQASDQAFSGFAALPPAVHDRKGQSWWLVFGCTNHSPTETVLDLYPVLAKERHPDRGGSDEAMAELNTAFENFKRERGLT